MILELEDFLVIAGIMISVISPAIALSWSTRMRLETLAERLTKIETEHKLIHKREKKIHEAF